MDGFDSYDKYLRAANYLTAAQIFLQDNFLLERELTFDDVKPRLLGHWGSCPGVNFTYMHLSKMVTKFNQDTMFVLGPGHAFPALQANIFLEGTLKKYYPQSEHTYKGIEYICKNFSWPYGFPSHSSPSTPGVILEGGELGYSLSTAYGAALDRPDLMVACLVGDGEAETGPAAAAWHINKLVDPKTNGTVLPILHLNGYKISGPTVFGRMSDEELKSLFFGYGYEPKIVSGQGIDQQMEQTLEWAQKTIKDYKQSNEVTTPRMPMIILRTPKGWSGVKDLNGLKIEDNYASHQVVLTEAKTNQQQLKMLEDWLKSYRFNELFDKEQGFGDFINDIIPITGQKISDTPYALGGEPVYQPLNLPNAELFSEDASKPGTIGSSNMRRVGLYLKEVFKLNQAQANFRLMSPDETYSNKLDAVFEQTSRAWVWPNKEWDKDMSRDGRVMEILSEHTLQGLTQGYILTGRHAVFASYEAFIQVVTSMMDQYAKFLNQALMTSWRKTIPSLNYILTSSGWRQDHNGFSHQNPGFINDALQRQGDLVNVYFPPDGNTALVCIEEMLKSTRRINIMVAGKTLEPRWLTPEKARQQFKSGAQIWDFASDENPDLVFAAAGDYMTKECLASIDWLKTKIPTARLRFVNVSALSTNGLGQASSSLSREDYENLFTRQQPVIFNFHGYPETIKAILFSYTRHPERFDIHGYVENGSTTTPFDMHVRNRTSRYHLSISALEKLASLGKLPFEESRHLIIQLENKLEQNTQFIKQNGLDLPEIDEWQWNR